MECNVTKGSNHDVNDGTNIDSSSNGQIKFAYNLIERSMVKDFK